MPKTGSNIYKRKDGRWEGRYLKGRNDNGKIIYGYVYANTCAEVKKRLSAKPKEVSKSVSSAETVSEVTEQWLSVMALKVKPSTLADYEATVRLHILPQLGYFKLSKLTAVSISQFTQEKLQHGRRDGNGELSPKTVRDILSVLKGILDFAVTEKLMESPVTITYPKSKQKTMRVLTHPEQSALKETLLEEINIYKVGILLCLYTGLRVGEVCALHWRDFSPGFDKLSVHRSIRRIKDDNGVSKTKIVIDTPKSKASVRDVPIPYFLSPILEGFSGNRDTYFISTSDVPLTEPRTMQYHFKCAVKAAEISDVNFHALRHTFSTRCIEAGVDIKSLSEMLGHANVNITLNRYVHSSFDQKREGMNRLETYLGL